MTLPESDQHEAFRGKSTNKVDSKGRVSIPADFRKILEAADSGRDPGAAASMVIVYGPPEQDCLLCYSLETINKFDRFIMGDTLPEKIKTMFEHHFITNSIKLQLDPNGRIPVSAALREQSKLDLNNPARFAGKGSHFEIWNPALHDVFAARIDEQVKSLAGPESESINMSALLAREMQRHRSQQANPSPPGQSDAA